MPAAAHRASPAAPTIALVSDAAGYGGAQVYLSQLASHLGDGRRFVVFVGDAVADETVARLERAGAEVRRIRGLRRIPTPASVIRLAEELARLRPSLVHVGLTDQGDGLGPLAAARLARRPLLATLHLVVPDRDRWRERVAARALRLPHLVIGVSQATAGYAAAAGASTTVVLNGIDPPDYAADARAELGLPRSALVVGGVGRVDPQKGWDVLCDAAELVRARGRDVAWVVVGDGPDLEAMRRRGESAGVRFAGYRAGASSLVPAFDILAVPSRYEAFGRVAAEAMLAGVPVVASAVDGLPEVVGDAGVLVPAGRADVLADAVLGLLDDTARRSELARRGRARAEERFAATRMVAETEAIYRRLAR
jgi:glycosyltransferase involved in cell wall biosynthesis